LAEDEKHQYCCVYDVENESGSKSDRVKCHKVEYVAGEPGAKCHVGAAEEKLDGNTPRSLFGREELTDCKKI
jgi:hypothetical protein